MTTDPREQEILRLASKLREVTEERDRVLAWQAATEQGVGEPSFYVSKSVIEKCETTAYFSVFVYSEPQYATKPNDLIGVYTRPPKPTRAGVAYETSNSTCCFLNNRLCRNA